MRLAFAVCQVQEIVNLIIPCVLITGQNRLRSHALCGVFVQFKSIFRLNTQQSIYVIMLELITY